MHQWLVEHQQSLSYLFQQNRMPHAIIISGAADVGKCALAHWLVGVLACEQCDGIKSGNEKNLSLADSSKQNNSQEVSHHLTTILQPCGQCKSCQLLKGQGHPDHLEIDSSGTSIGVDEIRNVTTFFEKTALLGKNQSVIIGSADVMTESAANALLKTLEEPTANSHIVLLTTEIERLLPTIISRCRHIALRAVNNNQTIVDNDSFAYLFSENEHVDAALVNQFTQLFYQFLAKPEQRSQVVMFMQEHTKSLAWSERLVTDLMRFNQSWLKISHNSAVEQQILARLQHLTHDDIWQLHLFISTCRKQILKLAQANKNFQIEKLLAEIAHYLIQLYAVDR